MKPTSKNVKGLTCWKRFGVLVLFAISGMNNVDSARCAIQKSPGSQAGAFITASHVRWVVRQLLATAFYFIPSAMTGFIVSVSPFRNRVSSKEAFEGLELGERKLSRPALRGPGGRKVAWLLGNWVDSSWLTCRYSKSKPDRCETRAPMCRGSPPMTRVKDLVDSAIGGQSSIIVVDYHPHYG